MTQKLIWWNRNRWNETAILKSKNLKTCINVLLCRWLPEAARRRHPRGLLERSLKFRPWQPPPCPRPSSPIRVWWWTTADASSSPHPETLIDVAGTVDRRMKMAEISSWMFWKKRSSNGLSKNDVTHMYLEVFWPLSTFLILRLLYCHLKKFIPSPIGWRYLQTTLGYLRGMNLG